MNEVTNEGLEALKKMRDKYVAKLFWLGLQSLLIFGGPAALAVLFGKNLDDRYRTANMVTIILICVAFIFSWSLFLAQWYRLHKKLKVVSAEMKKVYSDD